MDSSLLPPANQPVVAVVDDEPEVRRFLKLALAPLEGDIVELSKAAEFRAALDSRSFDCALVDLRLPDGSGLELAAEVQERGLATSLVLVSGFANVRVAVQAVQGGMIDVLEKPFEPAAVLAVVKRGVDLCRLRQADMRYASSARSRIAALSDSERGVLELVLAGHPNKVIAKTLGLGLRTVESRKTQLYRKLAADSLSELFHIAMAAGFTRNPTPPSAVESAAEPDAATVR
jgi:FixJ family two-component response regulator